mmetsp:Transcript_57285/g.166209  ORF Transcript_57285/g.166209 Transcript_57285/m.166209 type:complete len:399 (+) Transcript_57285:429-1625(+)
MTETYSSNLLQALQLDLDILEALLRKHRCSHGRTLYFRRMSMAHKAIVRYCIMTAPVKLQELQHEISEQSQPRKRRLAQEQEQWDSRAKDTPKKPTIKEQVQALQTALLDGIAECTSRIDHASQPLFLEVSRGFFLPFCTVALAALARLRAILLKLGKHCLSQLQDVVLGSDIKSLQEVLEKEKIEIAISRYLEEDKPSTKPSNTAGMVGMVSNDERRPILLQRLGLTPPKSSSRGKLDQKNSQVAESKAELHVRIAMPIEDDEVPNALVTASSDSRADDHYEKKVLSSSAIDSMELDDEEEDLGESMGVAATSPSSTAGAAAKANVKETDGNMEILASLQKSKSKKGKTKGKPNPTKEDKPRSSTKKRKEASSESKSSKKKKKKKGSKGDFFDSLFG